MTNPQTNPHSDEAFEASMRTLQSSLAHAIDRDVAPSRAGPPAARPVASTAPAPGGKWGPTNPRVTSPLVLLSQVADDARRLQNQLTSIVEAITGSPPPFRSREPHKLPNTLLPAISALATEIGSIHCEIATTLNQLKEDVS